VTAERAFIEIGKQSGPRNSRTDPVSGVRYYEWQGRWLPSVTTVRALAGVPRRLHESSLTKVIGRAIDRMTVYHGLLASGDPASLEGIRKDMRAAATEHRDRKGALGTAVHSAIEARLPLTAVGADVAPRLRQHMNWSAGSGVEVLAREFQVWNLTVGYAGTGDLLGRFPDGSIWVVDDKTGGDDWDEGLYPEQVLQLVPYLMGEFIGNDGFVDPVLTEYLHEARGIGILHLIDKGWEFRSLRATEAEWVAFRGLLAFALWAAANPDIDSVTLGRRRGAA
jgi:hypothetical protein